METQITQELEKRVEELCTIFCECAKSGWHDLDKAKTLKNSMGSLYKELSEMQVSVSELEQSWKKYTAIE